MDTTSETDLIETYEGKYVFEAINFSMGGKYFP